MRELDPRPTCTERDAGDRKYFKVTGLVAAALALSPDDDSRQLYARGTMTALMQKLDDMKGGLWVLGPPGCGKSSTVYAWATLRACKEKEIAWIHFKRKSTSGCLVILADSAKTCAFKGIKGLRAAIGAATHYAIILDGIVSQNQKEIVGFGTDLLASSKVVFVTSEGAATNYEDDSGDGVGSFTAYPWKRSEYHDAVRDNDFFDAVASKVGSHSLSVSTPLENRFDLVNAKEFVAGASARYMFALTAEEAAKQTTELVQKCSSFKSALDYDVGTRNAHQVHHLIMTYDDKKQFTVSKLALMSFLEQVELADSQGSVIRAYQLAQTNASFRGWVFESDFFEYLKSVTVKQTTMALSSVAQLTRAFANVTVGQQHTGPSISLHPPEMSRKHSRLPFVSRRVQALPVAGIMPGRFEICPKGEESLRDDEKQKLLQGFWLKPEKWRQPAWDTFFIRDDILNFVQVTAGNEHDYPMVHFSNAAEWLQEQLSQPGKVAFKGCRIFTIVPSISTGFTPRVMPLSGVTTRRQADPSFIFYSAKRARLDNVKAHQLLVGIDGNECAMSDQTVVDRHIKSHVYSFQDRIPWYRLD